MRKGVPRERSEPNPGDDSGHHRQDIRDEGGHDVMRISRRGAFTGLAVLALAGLLLVPIQMSWSAAEPIKITQAHHWW